MPKARVSAAVTLVLVGGLAGCQQKDDAAQRVAVTQEERAERDGVPVSQTAQPNYHFSPFYGGYVPFFVPIGGYSNGLTYHSHYNSLSPNERSAYPAPRYGSAGRPSGSGRSSTVSGGTSSPVSRGGFGSTGRSGFSASS